MISCGDCPPSNSNTNPCMTMLPYCNNQKTNDQHNRKSGTYRSSNCYRPLQQIYKTVYSPVCGNRSSRMDFACICRPSERYKTTNMSYGSFHYNNWAFMQKNRPINYDRQLFIECYDNKIKQMKLNQPAKSTNPFAK